MLWWRERSLFGMIGFSGCVKETNECALANEADVSKIYWRFAVQSIGKPQGIAVVPIVELRRVDFADMHWCSMRVALITLVA